MQRRPDMPGRTPPNLQDSMIDRAQLTVPEHDSALGMWVHAACQPPHLDRLVDSIWYFEGKLAFPRERIFPDGRVELNVHLGPSYRQLGAGQGEGEPFPAACVSGVMLRTAVIEAPGDPTAVLGIRLLPAGASELLGHPLHELTDLTVDLHDLVGAAAAELLDRCAAAVGAEARVRTAVRWIEDRAAARPCPGDPAVAWAAREIVRRRGDLAIHELRERVGWSRARFATAFKEQVGLSPKRLARIVRFRRALELLHRGDLALTEIALQAGYYDQPHFNGDFREFAGATPGQYLAARRYPGSVNLAEA
jgi:AraC-like DNA-binding protein